MLTLFHGSDKIIERPYYGGSRDNNDYGNGFYCSESSDLAREWSVDENRDGFLNCYELKELILPNTVTTIQGEGVRWYSKQSTSKLQVLNLGASLTTLSAKNSINSATIPGLVVICPDTLDGSTYNYEYFPKTAVVLFTGTKAQAEAFGFHSEAAGGKMMSWAEYVDAGKQADARTIVYGYSKCEAFYGGAHNYLDVEGNTCSQICEICHSAKLFEKPEHINEWIFNDNEPVSSINFL